MNNENLISNTLNDFGVQGSNMTCWYSAASHLYALENSAASDPHATIPQTVYLQAGVKYIISMSVTDNVGNGVSSIQVFYAINEAFNETDSRHLSGINDAQSFTVSTTGVYSLRIDNDTGITTYLREFKIYADKAVRDKIFIKTNSNLVYDANGTFKNLDSDIYTQNGVVFPKNNILNWQHTVLKSMIRNGDKIPGVYNDYKSSDTSKFVNSAIGADWKNVNDNLYDIQVPIVTNRLYKTNVPYNIMHPLLVQALDFFAAPLSKNKIGPGTYNYSMNMYGVQGNGLRGVGIIELQGAGGGSGGADNQSADCAGGGGGGGAYALIYYRVKTSASLTISIGSGGAAGAGGGSGSGKPGGDTVATFVAGGLTFTITAQGGGEGQGGNLNYTYGGRGGTLSVTGSGNQYTSAGGAQNTSNTAPGPGAAVSGIITSTNDIFLYLMYGIGGAAGGRGDDTDGNPQGRAGAGVPAMSVSFPSTNNTNQILAYPAQAGGALGANVSEAIAGGGGASQMHAGGKGGDANLRNGYPGVDGSGAGGAGVASNANRPGQVGGDGCVYYYL